MVKVHSDMFPGYFLYFSLKAVSFIIRHWNGFSYLHVIVIDFTFIVVKCGNRNIYNIFQVDSTIPFLRRDIKVEFISDLFPRSGYFQTLR